MKIEGAVIEEQGRKFAVVKVEKDLFEVPGRARDKMIAYQGLFPNMAVVFVAKEPGEAPNFYGRPDIVRFVMNMRINDIEWEEYLVDESGAEG